MLINGRSSTPLRLTAAAVTLSFVGFAPQHAAADFSLAGKTVTIFAVTGPGGGVGNHSRPVLPYISKNLPGNPSIVMKNMLGGGGIQAAQHMYNVAPKDGTAIAVFNPGALSRPLVTKGNFKYDLQKFNWIGSIASGATSCFVSKKTDIQTIEDAKKKEVAISTTGIGAGGTQFALLLNGLLGTKFKPIVGYNGTSETFLAVERGEVDGSCNSFVSMQASGQLAKGTLRVLVQGTIGQKDPDHPDVPSFMDLVNTEEDRQAITLLLTPYEIQYPHLLPPAVSPEIVAAYRKAFAAAVVDPDYIADTKRLNQNISPKPGDVVQELVNKMAGTPPAVRERATA